MRHTLKLPKLSETVDEMIIIEWLAQPGDRVEAGQPILVVETDKVTVEVPAPLAGVIVEHLVAVDDEVTPGVRIAVIDDAA